MIDRFGKEINFSELFMEETLSAKDKKELPDSMYGLVYTDEKGNKVRKFPLNDESHVRQAAIFFDRAKGLSDDQKRELARNIVRRAKELDMDYSGWESLKPYLDKPIKESFEEMFGPVIQEAATRDEKMIHIKPPKTDEVYFGSPTNHMPEIDLDRPLFVSPYKGITSIFIWRDWSLQNRIPGGSYNHNYEEWINFDEKKMKNPLKEVHVYVEGAPFLEPFTVEQEGYIHCISTKDYIDNFFRKPWMTKDLEYLIANTDNMKVEFTRSIRCKVKYYIKGKPAPKGKQYGPSKGGILRYIHEIANKIHAKYKADQKEPTGNQNCLLCSWCAEAQMRGQDYLPRPIYSPRDSALEIEPESMITGIKRVNLKGGYHSLLSHLKSAKEPFARWYCHVQWSNSNGGHEFLIVKIDDNSFEIMDAQQGTVKPLNADDYHVKDIDWNESYICRIDDKPFKYMKLDQINDPKKTLPWDPKKDIPYMVKHGMCTKEEAEKELKKTETNLFTSELKKALGQTHIQESADSLVLFKQLPKDLQEFLENGDYSMIRREDDSFYVVAGYWVEDFYKPSELELCGEAYSLEEDDPYYNTIIFSYENSNSFGFNPKDKSYYYFYHDEYEVKNGKEYIEPYKLKQKTWSEIIKAIPKERVYYRFEYEGEGIYEAYKRHATWLQWHKFKQTYAASWLNIVPNYRSGEKSYFTEEGYKMFMEHTYPEMIKVLDESKIEEIRVNLKPEDIRYEDRYQATTKVGIPEPKPIQESTLPDGVFLRPATLKDVPTMRDWQLESINARLRKRPDMFEYMEKDARESVPDTKMIMSGDRTIGMLQCCWIDNGEWWYIGEIYLIAEFRGRGIGSTLLLNEISEHDKLRLQVATDNPRAKALYESLGFKTVRMNQDMEVMDLVKTPESVCENMVEQLKSFKYGLGSNGSVHSASSEEYDEKYRLESPEEFEENGGGICYDYVEFMDKYLKEYGYHCRKFFISTDTKDMDTHTFILVDDGNGKFIYPESAFKLLEGTHIVKFPDEAIDMIMKKVWDINDNKSKYDKIKYYVWEYKDHPPYGSDMKTCHEYFTKGEPFYEGMIKNPHKRKE